MCVCVCVCVARVRVSELKVRHYDGQSEFNVAVTRVQGSERCTIDSIISDSPCGSAGKSRGSMLLGSEALAEKCGSVEGRMAYLVAGPLMLLMSNDHSIPVRFQCVD